MTKILIAESLDLDTLESIASSEASVLHYNATSLRNIADDKIHFNYKPEIFSENIENDLHEYDALIVRPKEVSGKAISSAPNLKLIVRGGAGLNSIDLKTASENGVVVENTPGQNSISTAEFTFAMIMEIVGNRYVKQAAADVRSGNAGIAEKYQGRELAGQKIAIAGLGNIGMEVAKRAHAFDMEVIYHNRNKKDVEYLFYDNLHELLQAKPDIISLHIPLTPDTDKIISKKEFETMKRGTILINCARPQLVDSSAFGRALQEGILACAGIDGDLDLIEPFIKADPENKCILTHHIADSTKQAQEKITRQVLYQVFAFFKEGKKINNATL